MSVDIPDIASPLLAWYDANARALPWRSLPGSAPPDPYRVWLSEVMLQQTTVTAVIPYFAKFTALWPTVEALAASDAADVMAAWAGLGYYSRARNLVACARAVAAAGGFPDTEAGLLGLPGVGPYTAAAIAAIALGHCAVVVDGNVERVVSRLFAVEAKLPGVRPELRSRAASITPEWRCGDFAQAMMDLGATICTPRSPKCLLCPVSDRCAARRGGDPSIYPRRATKAARPERQATTWWIERDGKVLLVRRPDKGLLGGMRALPSDLGEDSAFESGAPLGQVRHVFTHFSLTMNVFAACLDSGCVLPPGGEWWPLERIDTAGLPTVFAKAARRAMQGE